MNLLRTLASILTVGLAFLGQASTARAYALEGESWPANTTITLNLQLGNPPATLLDGSATWNQVAVDAMNVWQPYLGSGIQFAASYDTLTPAQGDGHNSVFFAYSIYGEGFGDGVLAVTLLQFTASNTTEADVIVNKYDKFDSYRGDLRTVSGGKVLYDLRRVLIHEFGHVLGLGHVNDGASIMYPNILDLDTVQPDDIAGIRAIYGTPGQQPTINAAPTAFALLNTAFTYHFTGAGGKMTYGASGLPAGLQIDPATGTISGTVATAGVFTVQLTASNGLGVATATLTLTADTVPTITSPGHVTALVGLPFSYQITATGHPTSFGPFYAEDGLTYDQASGLLSGLPTRSDFFYEPITATNGGGTASAYLTLDIEYDLNLTPLYGLGGLPSIGYGTLTLGADGNLYAVNGHGNGNNFFVICFTPQGQASQVLQLPDFNDGFGAELVTDPAGNFYGAIIGNNTALNQPPRIVRITLAGGISVLYQFADGSDGNPHSALCLARDGSLYGELDHGISSTGGAIFRVTPGGVCTVLHRLDSATEGDIPFALTEAPDGNLYGVTHKGGPGGAGTVFEITPGGAFTVLKSFANDSASGGPDGPLTVGSDGNLYGTLGYVYSNYGYYTSYASQSAVYRVVPGGQVAVVRSLDRLTEGQYPVSFTRGADGALYGFGSRGNNLFPPPALQRFRLDGSSTDIHRFQDRQSALADKPTLGADGNFYCAAGGGGSLGEYGAIVRIDSHPSQTTYVSVQATVPQAVASTGQRAVFTLSRNGVDLSHDLPVHLTFGGPARAGVDYAPLAATLTIPVGASSVTGQLTATNVSLGTNAVAVNVQVDAGDGYTINSNSAVASLQVYGAPPVSHPDFFAGETPLAQEVYYLAFPANGNIFGYYTYLSDPHFVYHFDLGFEYVIDAADGHSGVYLYDFKSGDFFYTSPTFPFPYLYDFALNAFLYYFPDPTNPQRYNTNGVRYFYNFSTGQTMIR